MPASQPTRAYLARFDIYGPMHKAMRLAMGETLSCLGRADAGTGPSLARALERVDELLLQLRLQLNHERDFVHTAIEARRPGASRTLASLLHEHGDTLRGLRRQVAALREAAEPAERLQSLYRQLALFVADTLNRMARQESAHGALLWALYSDAELRALQARQLAALPPAELQAALAWMSQALCPRELLPLLQGMREIADAAGDAGACDLSRAAAAADTASAPARR